MSDNYSIWMVVEAESDSRHLISDVLTFLMFHSCNYNVTYEGRASGNVSFQKWEAKIKKQNPKNELWNEYHEHALSKESNERLPSVIDYLVSENGGSVWLGMMYQKQWYELSVSFCPVTKGQTKSKRIWLICMSADDHTFCGGSKEAEDFDNLAQKLCSHLNKKELSCKIITEEETWNYE